MSEVEIENLIALARSDDEESNKLAISILEHEYPDKLSYAEYLKKYQDWIYTPTMEYLSKVFYYKLIWCGYMPYLGIPTLKTYKTWKSDDSTGECYYSEVHEVCTDGLT